MIEQIDHVGIAVHSIEEAAGLYRDVFELEYRGSEVVDEQSVRVAFFEAGEAMIELIEPTDDDSPVARFLEKNGPGIHHLALRCDDIDGERATVAEAGIRLLSDRPRRGAHDKLISFMHPKDTGGVLLELTQRGGEQ